MMSEQTFTQEETVRVSATIDEPELPSAEVMYALPDPADPDQAVLANVPVLVDGINYGDLVRLGPEDECGVRPITEVIVPSGHVHFVAAAEPGEAGDLVAELERSFPGYALRVEGTSDSIVSVSVHPDLDADEVAAVAAAWLVEPTDDPHQELPVAPPSASSPGPR